MTSVTSAVYLTIWLMHNLEELGEWLDNGFNCICFYRCCLFHSSWYVTVNLESASSSQWKQPFAFTWQGLQNTFNFLPQTYISSMVFGFSFVLSNLDHLTNPQDTVLGLYTDVIMLRGPGEQEGTDTLVDLVRHLHTEGGRYILRKTRELSH